jgi:hypothetical protein
MTCIRLTGRHVQLGIGLLLMLWLPGCVKEEAEWLEVNDTAQLLDEVDDNGCDTLLPVVFMHGALASGDTYATQVQRFTSNGYCNDLLYAYDWNTLGGGGDVNSLDAFIDTVLARTGATQVNLVGHSAGGGLGYSYCSNAAHAAKVAHYVHIGSSSQAQPAGPAGEVPTLCISSADDAVTGAVTVTGAENVTISGLDHYQVATGAEPFRNMYRFFHGGTEPQTTSITTMGASVCVAGRGVTLGENAPKAGASVRIYEIDPATGLRLSQTPDHDLTTDSEGYWGPVNVKNGVKYEFEITPGGSDRVIHYYREGFIHDNPLVYLRAFPPASSTAGLLLSGIPSNDDQTAMAVFTANQAVVAGRDDLTVNGTTLSTPAFTPASNTVIAMFLFDGNGNGQSDLTVPGLFGLLNVFLSARDMFIPTTPPAPVPLVFNGRAMAVPNLRSASDGVIVAVFD